MFRDDAALIAALSAAGTVTAAACAAIAAVGSMRAAAESTATAERAREALARTTQPRVRPTVDRAVTPAEGHVIIDSGSMAIDVTAVWQLSNGETITSQVAVLHPGGKLTTELTLTSADHVELLWVSYWDTKREIQWQDTWYENDKVPGDLQLTESHLAG